MPNRLLQNAPSRRPGLHPAPHRSPNVAIASGVALAGLAISAATLASAPQLPPCPPDIQLPCSSGESSPGNEHGPAPQCVPGAGQWVASQQHAGTPASPIDRSDEYSVGWTRWSRATHARAEPNQIVVGTSLQGQSVFLGAATQATSATGGFSTLDRELWMGDPPAAPRLVQLSAEGFAAMGLSVVCAPRIGCSAAGSISVSGSCSSLGSAWAQLPARSLNAAASYDAIARHIRLAGRIGGRVDDSGMTYTGEISAIDEIFTQGTGVAAGSASYSVKPDRTYCAFTNRPVVRRGLGNAVATLNVSVEAGHAAASAVAMVRMGVN